MAQEVRQFKLNLPEDVKRWVAVSAAQNMRSQSAEIIFALKEKMQAATGEGFADTAPAAVTRTGALQGPNSTNGL